MRVMSMCYCLVLWAMSACTSAPKQVLAPDRGKATVKSPWPVYTHINTGETQTITVGGKDYQVMLEHIEYVKESNNRTPASIGSQTLKEARVTLSVNGKKIDLFQRPYQMPVTFMGLRLYVENTREWVEKASAFEAIAYFPKDARIAFAEAGKSWGPSTMRFPLVGYRLRSSSYNNTWSSLVPGTGVYYHHGEDFGAVPERYDIQAILDGVVKTSPLPNGDGASNGLIIEHDADFSYRLSHMNIGSVRPEAALGRTIKSGQLLAKNGRTNNGKEDMDNPHLHINFIYKNEPVSTYPYLMEAYLRDYPGNVLAVAGGTVFAMAGEEIELDATRSIVRDGHTIGAYSWELPDGEKVEGARARIHFNKPGTYPVTLDVKTEQGDGDRDFLQVYVFDGQKNANNFLGYFYTTPVRGIKAGSEVTLWRAWKADWTTKPIIADFGDGTKPAKTGLQTRHIYQKPGIYTVTLTSDYPIDKAPATVKVKIVVEK